MDTNNQPPTPEQIVEQLRALRAHIPDFGALTVPAAQALRRTSAVDDAFLQAAINTVGASEYIAAAIGTKAETLRVERDDIGRWSAVEDELRATVSPRCRRTASRGSSPVSTSTPNCCRTWTACAG
jgi:hypothetical protein